VAKVEEMPMSEARIDGRPVTLEAAVAYAAKLVAASRLPVIAGLGTDIAGARAAIALAERVGGVFDHMHSDALLRDLVVMRQAGAYVTTPNEARLRGDTLLLIGPGLIEAWPELGERLLSTPLAPEVGSERRVFWLCPGKSAVLPGVKVVGRSPGELAVQLALLRASVGGRLAKAPKAIAELAKGLPAARFGVAVWSAAALDDPTIEMLFGLIDELNAGTRFTGLPLAPTDNAIGVTQASGWMTGFPPRTGFGRGYPEHDPWRFDARRLIEDGEADCAMWISAHRPTQPRWRTRIPTITLAAGEPTQSGVAIQVGRPAIDHDCTEHDAQTGTLVARGASSRSDIPSVAAVIARIAAALPGGAWPC
jgi:formylmethanofuran dehydrogenase subunit B